MTKGQKCVAAMFAILCYSYLLGGLYVVAIVAASAAIGMWIERYIDE